MATKKKKLIVIAGPTAVGKTAVAIAVARHLQTEIISADSRQCYRELNIGVARPTEEELLAVKHHFIASHSIHEKVNAVTFEQYALTALEDIYRDHDVAVVVGGTGLYMKALLEGMDEIPEVPDILHRELIHEYNQNGLVWLQEQVRLLDSAFYEKGEIQNPHRLLRALEVWKATGRSLMDFRKGEQTPRNFEAIKIGLQLPRADLHHNINTRVDAMMQHGLLEEVRLLIPWQQLNALQTVGYRELFDHFNGEISLPGAIERIKISTRQYAKRQLTWFKKDNDFHWCLPNAENVMAYLEEMEGSW
jgi:tRNA dimethylallyltransferase